ncbi:CBP4-domain-containing protein [Kickxella alabastrina]|uniref:CBP4-domain-containing protein n=1 Tax=Kickxella alabastrina TaxID=61397 RepID=UPI0022201E26|nr:CBP4-domain-containing protein [Kickxella alabastrina]KAI7823938.1 CBP4-domain-containing protein [Kickxella alabastrina]
MSFRRGMISFAGIMGVAVLLRCTIVPDEEKILRSMSAEVRADYERNKDKRREQHDAIMAQIIENSKSDKPIWDVTPPPKREFISKSLGLGKVSGIAVGPVGFSQLEWCLFAQETGRPLACKQGVEDGPKVKRRSHVAIPLLSA